MKELLEKIAIIYSFDAKKGQWFLDQLSKATEDEMVDSLLAEYGDEDQQGQAKPKRFSRSRDWKAADNLTPEQLMEIKQHVKNGYSEREAHRLAGAHKEQADFHKAGKSGINPSMMSDKRINELKALSGEWLNNANRLRQKHADPEKNPILHATGKILDAHEQYSSPEALTEAIGEYKNSDEYKNAHKFKRKSLLHSFEENWHKENPEHREKHLNSMEEAKQTGKEGLGSYKQGIQEKLGHILRGGAQQTDMSAQEAAQHAGINLSEEGEKHQGAIQKDPFANFASNNPEFVNKLSQEQRERLKRYDSARAIKQGATQQPAQSEQSGQPAQPAQPQTVIRRRKKDA